MKKLLSIFLVIFLVFSMAGCANDKSPRNPISIIDLTALTPVMVYSTVYDMINQPDKYVGEQIVMRGTCSTFVDEEKQTITLACIIQDATACCQQGIEFQLNDDYEEFPEDGKDITVVGEFAVYEEGEYFFPYIANATYF